ncbi:16S rRNA (adenine(1518)-N(6)/adenine(1519)-N(6))-dimethyltransferase RsmA [Malacoplasma muris]|uniref:16S rRNA (adenine(1518)-N(6)/adenine(1519)-N(6))- dimethyltransferase RsmA n=1 Tax=Malacoplasma muris TaxID=2119 RepID=UPI00398F629C
MENNQIIKFLKDNNFFPSKKLGQNFLLSNDYKNKIVNLVPIDSNDFVLEIGPGFGALTDFIIKKTHNLTLIEFDKRLYEFLNKKYNQINIINHDILKLNLNEILDKNKFNKSIVISNLPYSISSQVLINLLKTSRIDCMVLMVQKEMADRITSKVGSTKYNGFSILISLLADVKKEFDVPSTVFYPEPHVISTVIKVIPKKKIDFDLYKMEKFLKICFLNKRKKLVNNLKTNFSKKTIYNCFNALNLDENVRPEQLDKNQYVLLMKELKYGN